MSTPEAIIDMHGIVKTFKNAAGEVTVLKGIDLTIQPRRIRFDCWEIRQWKIHTLEHDHWH